MGRIKCFCATTWLHANRASGIKALQGTVASFQFVAEFFSPTSSPRVTGLLSLSLGTVTTQVGHHKADGSLFLLGGEAGNYIVMYNYSYSNCNSIEITKGKAVLWHPPTALRAVTLPLCFPQRRRIQPTGFLAFSRKECCSVQTLSTCWRSQCEGEGEAGFWDSALPCACKLMQVAVAVWAACPGTAGIT